MTIQGIARTTGRGLLIGGLVAALASCGGTGGIGSGNLFKRKGGEQSVPRERTQPAKTEKRESTIWDLFANTDDPNVTVEVNKYIWQAALEILHFLPIESVDPFSGVIVTGYGTPPGGGRAYRATIYVQDPALDARSLKLSLVSRSGPVSPDTVAAVEDAILTRARQLRIRDSKL